MVPESKSNKKSIKTDGKPAKNSHETFIQKLPMTKLATIAGLSPVRSFCEAFCHFEELIQTMDSKMTSRTLELVLIILKNICNGPFVEHRKVFLEKLKGCDTFWKQTTEMTTDLKKKLADMEKQETFSVSFKFKF